MIAIGAFASARYGPCNAVARVLRVLLVLAILLATPNAFAFCRSTTCNVTEDEDCDPDENGCPTKGRALVWSTSRIGFAFSERGSSKLDDDRVRTAIRSAFQRWQDVSCVGGRTTLQFVELPDLPAKRGSGLAASDDATGVDDGTPPFGIFFRDSEWPADHDKKALALTTVSYRGPLVEDVRMEINTATTEFQFENDQKPDAIDFQAVVTHEVGHYIGIAHSNVEGSIMAPDYCHWTDRCDVGVRLKRSLSTDDRAAVCALFPPVAPTLPPTGDVRAETAGCSTTPATAPGAGAAFFLAAVAAAAARKKARARG